MEIIHNQDLDSGLYLDPDYGAYITIWTMLYPDVLLPPLHPTAESPNKGLAFFLVFILWRLWLKQSLNCLPLSIVKLLEHSRGGSLAAVEAENAALSTRAPGEPPNLQYTKFSTFHDTSVYFSYYAPIMAQTFSTLVYIFSTLPLKSVQVLKNQYDNDWRL